VNPSNLSSPECLAVTTNIGSHRALGCDALFLIYGGDAGAGATVKLVDSLAWKGLYGHYLLDAEIGGKAWRLFKFPAHTHSS
jgi:hypothetical protein